MNKSDLVKQLTALIDQFERDRVWGTIEVTFSNGVPTVVKRTETTRIEGEPRNAQQKTS